MAKEKKKLLEEKELNEEPVIVIDNGSGYVKAGWSGEDAPRLVIPTIVAYNNFNNQYLVGSEALRHVDDVTMIQPIVGGEIKDYDTMKKIWEYIFKELEVDEKPMKYPVLISDTLSGSPDTRRKLASSLFDLDVPSLCLFNQNVLSLFAAGHTRGVVIESGEGITNVVPIFEGYPLQHAAQFLPIAGGEITQYLYHLLLQNGCQINNTPELLRDIKEKLAYVAPQGNLQHCLTKEGQTAYELPDGQMIYIPDSVRVTAPELLFRPSIMDNKNPDDNMIGLPNLVYNSINSCDNLLQNDLWSKIVVAGGNTNLTGFVPRLQYEMDLLAKQHNHPSIPVRICEDLKSQRKYAAWIGGSLFASLSKFSRLAIQADDFKDDSNIIFRKSFT